MGLQPLQLIADPGTAALTKIIAAAKLAGCEVQTLSDGAKRTPCGLSVPVLRLPNQEQVRHTNAILRRIAQEASNNLLGRSFVEEGQVDSWLEWVSLEVDHVLESEMPVEPICEVIEAHSKSRTFLVGQRLTLADISLACSVKQSFEKKGLVELQQSFPNTIRWLRTCLHQIATEDSPAVASTQKAAPAAAPAAPAKGKGESKDKGAPKDKGGPKEKGEPKETGEPKGKAEPKDEGEPKEGGKEKAPVVNKKEERKKKKEEEAAASQEAKFKGPDLTLDNFEEQPFGNIFIQSERKTNREWTSVISLNESMKDKMVWLRARVQGSRKQSQKLCFLVLRQDLATVQAVVFGPQIAGFAGNLPDESVVDIYGKVAVPDAPIKTCSQSTVEISVEKIYCIGRSTALPLQLADLGRSDTEFEADPSLVTVDLNTRLDNRVIDLRTVANQGIFRIQSGVCTLFREYLLQESFQEIHTPKMIGGASEGGAEVFEVKYFQRSAFLAQSPQLYKQMALMTDMPRVFEIGPVFRSENSFTHRHMTEFTGLDMEMVFNDHYHEVLDVLDGLFNHIFTGLKERFPKEIEAVRAQFPFEDLKWKYPCLRLTFKEAVQLLRAKGPAILEEKLKAAENDDERKKIKEHLASVKAHEDLEDISTADERVLGAIIRDVYGEELYIIDKFPADLRPFYTMPDPKDPKLGNAYDIFLRGEEITSGAQRIHDSKFLAEQAEKKGINVSTIQAYVEAFKYGSYPHAGGGIGMERVVMLFLNLNNIRKTSMFPRDPKRLMP